MQGHIKRTIGSRLRGNGGSDDRTAQCNKFAGEGQYL